MVQRRKAIRAECVMKIDAKITIESATWQDKEAIEDEGQLYVVCANKKVIGAYYSKNRELTMEDIPKWLWRSKLDKKIKKFIEETLGVKVRTVAMEGRDFT